MITVHCLSSGSSGNSYAVDDGESVLLLEAGIPARRIATGYLKLLPRVSGCLITHEHGDHAKGAAKLSGRGIDLYMTAGTQTALGEFKYPYRIHTVKAQEQFSLGSWIVLPFDTEHDAAEPVGFLLASSFTHEKLLFATDTYYIKYRFSGVNVFMVECNYSLSILQQNLQAGRIPENQRSRLLHSHFSLEHVIDFFKLTDLSAAQKIYLLHASDRNSDQKLFKDTVQRVTGVPTKVL
ncbi:Metallo-beta-lactamase superfamily domain protein in prophage [Ruminococcaceae bacterium BL-4]|nr:Metallo-beta-lactamase superfamily domain protein in prophage [Ruminococcaceae bacterium BL-4]